MSKRKRDRQRYELLYEQLLLRAMQMHDSNKKRIRVGLVLLAVVPVLLCFVRWLTGSDKVVFLIIWIVFMFVICAYLIGVEYMDDSLQKMMEEVTKREVEFDDLHIGAGQIQDRLHERAAERREMLSERSAEMQEALQRRIEARRGKK